MGALPPGGIMGEAAAQAHVTGEALVTVMTTLVTVTTTLVSVMVTVVVVDKGVEAAGMTGMMTEVEVAGMTGMMMEGGAGMVAPQGVQGVQLGKAARSAGPRLNSGIGNGRQSSDVPMQAFKDEHYPLGLLLSSIFATILSSGHMWVGTMLC